MKRETVNIGGRDITLETGRIAKQASGSCLVTQDNTVVLVTVVADEKQVSEDMGFFPLSVEYREKSSAIGRIPAGFIKREKMPTNHEILCSRLVDRSIRPLFPSEFACETQVIANVLSFDPKAEAEALAIMGAGVALHISDIPWRGPVVGIRITKVGKKIVLFPTKQERESGVFDLMLSYGPQGMIMMEGEAQEAPEQEIIDAILYAQESIKPFLDMVQRWQTEIGKPKRSLEPLQIDQAFKDEVIKIAEEPIRKAIMTPGKQERKKTVDSTKNDILVKLGETYPERTGEADIILNHFIHDLVRRIIIKEKKRIDNRTLDEIRPISGEVSWLPCTHGSSIFTRGETQAIVSCTLGGLHDEQIEEDLLGGDKQRFFLHYNFPPFSVGEVRPLKGPGRREIGHGNLAQRALKSVIPGFTHFPYTIRLVSDITESNGSSSMATVCGGCLALMDAGVPISRPVAGIAMGLIKEGEEVAILSDILGDEDHLGDMDFKVTGTEAGVTAMQMDNKIGALSGDILAKALDQANKGRLHILNEMKKILPTPRPDLAPHAPRVIAFKIRKERIKDLIGPGGAHIQEIQEISGSKVDVDDIGRVFIYSSDQSGAQEAFRRIRYLTAELEVGKVYRGTIMSVKDFGVFVKIFSSTEGLVHISEMANERINHPGDIVREGQEIVVRVLGVDRQGKIRLSRKDALDVNPAEIIEGTM